MTRRRPTAVAKGRGSKDERVSLKPLTYEEAVRGLFSVKPAQEDEESEASDGD